MTQSCKYPRRPPANPAEAACRCAPIDDLLDPELFRALCDPTRARLLACLVKCDRPCAVTELADCCSVDLSVVSRHLRLLEQAGVLASERTGRNVTYAVRTDHLCGLLRGLADAIQSTRTTPTVQRARP